MKLLHILLGLGLLGGTGAATWYTLAADPPLNAPKPPSVKPTNDAEMVERVIATRKEYQQSLEALYSYYIKSGDRERAKWVEEELKGYHMLDKPSYRLDILDVPPPTLEAKVNMKEANDLYRQAMEYKDKGYGQEFLLNQRRTEILLQEVLAKYPNCDKIADVAYQLGDLYEGRAYKQYARAAAYFERSYQWRKGVASDARMRAAKIYDRHLNERGKAVELYRDQIAQDTDTTRIREAEKRLGELTSNKK